MVRLVRGSLLKALKFAGFTLLGGLSAAVLVSILYLNSLPELDPWHTAHLANEYKADGAVHSFAEYLALEDRLFNELDEKVISRLSFGNKDEINRFQPDSVSNPKTWPQNWNRTFVLESEDPAASVLLLHGMSDSPYSLRQLGLSLHAAGATVVGLRLPGHGTAPAGLLDITAEDMASATALAVAHLHQQAPGRPLYLVGYSNGAALAIVHALRQLEDPNLPKIDKIVTLSPAIGVTPAAAYAPLAIQLGHILGVQRLAWSSTGPEYDPYKYTSFAINAGYVTHKLTMEIRTRMDAAARTGSVKSLPPVLGFSSAVDATVVTQDMISNLYSKLPANGSELFLFGTNRFMTQRPLLTDDTADFIAPLAADEDRTYTLRLLVNETQSTRRTALETYPPGTSTPVRRHSNLTWPKGVFSLAHVSLPFSSSDPLYGITPNAKISGLQLGALALRGERGISQVPPADMLRMRWNPFHAVMLSEIKRFLDLQGSIADTKAH